VSSDEPESIDEPESSDEPLSVEDESIDEESVGLVVSTGAAVSTGGGRIAVRPMPNPVRRRWSRDLHSRPLIGSYGPRLWRNW
jgi:hypothetical protein